MRYPVSLLLGALITVAMLWAITELTSQHPDGKPPRPLSPLRIAAVMPSEPAAETLPEPEEPLPEPVIEPDPEPEPIPEPPDLATLPPMAPPTLPEPVLDIDLPGKPLLGARPQQPKPRPKPRPKVTPKPQSAVTAGAPSPPVSNAAPAATGERQLHAIYKPAPKYPRRARRRHQQGAVKLRFAVQPDGRVEDIQVVWSRPPGVFDREAKRTLARWRFEPARKHGRAISARASQVITFKLDR